MAFMAALLCGLHAVAQQPVYEFLGREAGLRGKSYYHCMESNGRLWVASERGVAWFDGKAFRELGPAEGMPEVNVIHISEGRDGALWFHTLDGIPIRYKDGVACKGWGTDFAAKMRGSSYVSAFCGMDDGGAVFGTNDGRAIYIDAHDNGHLLFKGTWSTVQEIRDRGDGVLEFQFSANEQLVTWDKGRLEERRFKPLLGRWPIGKLRTTALRNGQYIYAVEDHVVLVERSADSLRVRREFWIPHKNVLYVGEDRLGDIWLGTSEGALRYASADTAFARPQLFLPGKVVSSVCRDHEGGIWLSSDGGVYHCRSTQVRSNVPPPSEARDEATRVFLAADGLLYVGYNSGKVEVLDRQTLAVRQNHVPDPMDGLVKVQRFGDGPSGQVLIGGDGGMRLLQGGRISRPAQQKLNDFALQGGQAAFCLFANWCRMQADPAGRWLALLPDSLKRAQSSLASRCLHCAFDSRGRLWVATVRELLLVQGAAVDTVLQRDQWDERLRNTLLRATKAGAMAFGTEGRGLLVTGQGWRAWLHAGNGLLDNKTMDLEEDAHGNAWILTDEGISKARIGRDGVTLLFSRRISDHFGDAKVHDIALAYDTMWAATNLGVIALPTAAFEQAPSVPELRITGLIVDGNHYPVDSFLHLPTSQNDVRIEFQALTFTDHNRIEYRYRLRDDDPDFHATMATAIDLPDAQPGRYRIEVQARLPFGQWSRSPAVVNFEIHPPTWQSWWFISLAVVTLLAIGAGTAALVVRNVRRKSAMREALTIARHEALMNQMNPHFVFNALNSIQSYIYDHDVQTASAYLADFASLMRAILSSGRAPRVTLADEVKFLNHYLRLEALRLDQRFTFEITVAKGIVPQAQLLPSMMLQPLLENAVWHGVANLSDRAGQIKVHFSIQGAHLVCQVVDNGVGRKAAAAIAASSGKLHRSAASDILAERIALLNREKGMQVRIDVRDLHSPQGDAAGTEVLLYIPLRYSTNTPHDQDHHRR